LGGRIAGWVTGFDAGWVAGWVSGWAAVWIAGWAARWVAGWEAASVAAWQQSSHTSARCPDRHNDRNIRIPIPRPYVKFVALCTTAR